MARLHTHDQHFLRSPHLVLELIGHSNICKNDLVYDLGAGSGVITSALARRARQVVAVEIEPAAVAKLRANAAQFQNVTILEQDILTLPLPDAPYKIFANPPFSLSSDIVRKFTVEHGTKALYLIAQKQFAQKLSMDTRSFTSMLGAQIAPWYTVRIRRPLRRTDFTPPPGVDTVLVEIKKRPEPLLSDVERTRYQQFVEQCFARQKYFQQLPRESASISAEKSPSQLSVEQWLSLYRSLTS